MAKKQIPPRKGPAMATVATRREKSAEDELLDSFGKLIDDAAEKMTHEEFVKTSKKAT